MSSKAMTALAAAAVAVLVWAAAQPALAGIRVVASIKPVHSLAASIMQGVGEPRLLIPGTVSPHGGALRPSQARALREADLVFWIGPEMETFLERPLAGLARGGAAVALSQAPDVKLLALREGGVWPAHEPAAEDTGEHDEEGQGHGDHDMHIWLDTDNARAMAAEIAAALTRIDPAHRAAYAANAKALDARLAALDEEIRTRLAPVREQSYIVFHDAYQYLEARYGLSPAGAVTLSPEIKPGARRIAELRRAVRARGAVCVFAEPQFEPRLLATLTEGTGARSAELDPLGADVPPGPDAYAAIMRALAGGIADCLSGEA